MIASRSQKEMESIGSISRKENRYARSKNGRRDLKIQIFVGNDYGLTSCENVKIMGDSERLKAVETRCVRIKVRRFENIGEGRRNTIGWSVNKNNRQLINWKSKMFRGIKMNRSKQSIRLKSRSTNMNEY